MDLFRRNYVKKVNLFLCTPSHVEDWRL